MRPLGFSVHSTCKINDILVLDILAYYSLVCITCRLKISVYGINWNYLDVDEITLDSTFFTHKKLIKTQFCCFPCCYYNCFFFFLIIGLLYFNTITIKVNWKKFHTLGFLSAMKTRAVRSFNLTRFKWKWSYHR